MKSYLRIIITAMVTLCVTIASFAGAKKCYKKPAISRYYLSISQKPGSHEKNDSNSHKEYCTSAHFIIDNRKEEEYISWRPDADYITRDFPFQEKDYSNPPFAPPRFSNSTM